MWRPVKLLWRLAGLLVLPAIEKVQLSHLKSTKTINLSPDLLSAWSLLLFRLPMPKNPPVLVAVCGRAGVAMGPAVEWSLRGVVPWTTAAVGETGIGTNDDDERNAHEKLNG